MCDCSEVGSGVVQYHCRCCCGNANARVTDLSMHLSVKGVELTVVVM